jgi:hypothetical protein
MCLALALVACSHSVAMRAQESDSIDRTAAAVRTFTERVDRYVWMRARFEEPLPSFDARRDPWSLMLTRRYLAAAIRTARARARLGDIFAPPVAQLFRGIIADAIYDVEIEGLVDEGLETADLVDVVINEPVPDWALREVPEAVLARLPAVPDAIGYRIVGGNLILWDTHAEIVVDALSNAFIVE